MHVYVCVSMCLYVCECVLVHICVYVRACVRVSTCLCACVCSHTLVLEHVCAGQKTVPGVFPLARSTTVNISNKCYSWTIIMVTHTSHSCSLCRSAWSTTCPRPTTHPPTPSYCSVSSFSLLFLNNSLSSMSAARTCVEPPPGAQGASLEPHS